MPSLEAKHWHNSHADDTVTLGLCLLLILILIEEQKADHLPSVSYHPCPTGGSKCILFCKVEPLCILFHWKCSVRRRQAERRCERLLTKLPAPSTSSLLCQCQLPMLARLLCESPNRSFCESLEKEIAVAYHNRHRPARSRFRQETQNNHCLVMANYELAWAFFLQHFLGLLFFYTRVNPLQTFAHKTNHFVSRVPFVS